MNERAKGTLARVGIVASEFNMEISRRLLEGAKNELSSHSIDLLDVVWVSGAFEIPAALKAMVKRKRYDALLALGCVVRGETPHFEYISMQCAAGCMRVSVDAPIPVGFGVLTVDTYDQALVRSSENDNKGVEAAKAAVNSLIAMNRILRPTNHPELE